MNILITGGAGFIGSNLANFMSAESNVTVVDNLFLGKKENLSEKVEFLESDVTEKDHMEKIFRKRNFDYVFHMASVSSAPMYFDGKCPEPSQWVKINLLGFTNIIEMCNKYNIKKMVYASTSSIYSGNPTPFKETQKINPKTFYEVSMYMREYVAESFKLMHNFNSVGLRFFAVYGYRENHKRKYRNLITQFIEAMMRDEKPEIYGDGFQSRDFIFIEDVIEAMKLSITTEMKGVFNVGTGKSYTAKDIVNIINEKLGKNIEPVFIQNPLKNYVEHTLADIEKIKNFGFKPKIDIENGIKKLVEYYKKNPVNHTIKH